MCCSGNDSCFACAPVQLFALLCEYLKTSRYPEPKRLSLPISQPATHGNAEDEESGGAGAAQQAEGGL